jgi:hypothetical protein
MSLDDVLQIFYGLAVVLTLLPGLWLAYRLIRRLSTVIPWLQPDPEGELHWFQLLAWLALGGLLSAPFIDLVSFLQGISQLSPASVLRIPSPGQTYSYWTNLLVQLQWIFPWLLTLIVYILVIRLLLAAYRTGKLAFVDQLGLERLDRIMLMLALAALTDRVVRQIVLYISIGFQAATILGLPGFVAGWILGLILLALVLNFLGQRLFKLEEQSGGRLHPPL